MSQEFSVSHRSVAESGCLSFPCLATVPSTEKVGEVCLTLMTNNFYLICMASLSSQPWCQFLSWTLVLSNISESNDIGAFLSILMIRRLCRQSFGLNCRWQQVPILQPVVTAGQIKSFLLWRCLFPMHLAYVYHLRGSSHEITSFFNRRIMGSKTIV